MLTEQQKQNKIGRIGASELNKIFNKPFELNKIQATKSKTIDEKYLKSEAKKEYIYEFDMPYFLEKKTASTILPALKKLAIHKGYEKESGNILDNFGRLKQEQQLAPNLEFGIEHEQAALQLLNQELKITDVAGNSLDSEEYQEPEIKDDAVCIHPDGYHQGCPIEVKSVELSTMAYIHKEDAFNQYYSFYQTQMQMQILYSKATHGYFAISNENYWEKPIIYKKIEKDFEHCEQIKEAVKYFESVRAMYFCEF